MLKFFLLLFFYFFQSTPYALTPFSNRELEELEKEFVQEINHSNHVLRNPLVNQYINHLGLRLAQFAGIPKPHFFIIKSHDINAFAGPGGHIGINTELIVSTDSESELAAVMAHELAHVRLHHLYSLIEHQKKMQIPMLASMLASIALGAVNPTLGSSAMMASLTGFAQNSINFTRAKEKEADRIGIDMLIRAGLNPRAMAGFFKKLQLHSRYYYTDNIPAILRTHPLDDDRIAEADNRSLHLAQKSYADSLDYQLFKELVRVSAAADNSRLFEYYRRNCVHALACQYGKAINFLNLNQYESAKTSLMPLLRDNKDNLFFQIAMSDAEVGNKNFDDANYRLKELLSQHPENYAVLLAYAKSLLESGKASTAVSILLKGQRIFKQDLELCKELAKAQSAAARKAYAYFTESQCHLLQGQRNYALRQLKLAKALAKNDPYLRARADALIDEIKFMRDN